MHHFLEFNITTFLSPFINTVLSFPNIEYYLWLDSKYNVRRCDVWFRIKQFTV